MAGGRRRLGAAVARRPPDDLADLLGGLVAHPSPAGAERPLAEWLVRWAGRRWPDIDWRLQPLGRSRANVVARARSGRPPALVIYSHLDTSLSGDESWDRFVTGARGPARRLRSQGDTVSGPGVVVAKGPAAAATVGFVAAARSARRHGGAHDLILLLAAGGTHRACPPGADLDPRAPSRGAGAGVRRFLSTHRPAAAVVAKAGPAGILHEEPGAAFLVVRVEGAWAPVMSRHTELPDGGVPAAAGSAIRGVERWRRQYRRRPLGVGSQVGREAGVGALRCGLPYKADLVGGVLELYVYAATGPGDEPSGLADELRAHVRRSVAEDRRVLAVDVDVVEAVASERTDPRSAIATASSAAWQDVVGTAPPPVRRWTGSTDGVVFRSAGVDAARTGPEAMTAEDGAEALRWGDLHLYARLYQAIADRWLRYARRDPTF